MKVKTSAIHDMEISFDLACIFRLSDGDQIKEAAVIAKERGYIPRSLRQVTDGVWRAKFAVPVIREATARELIARKYLEIDELCDCVDDCKYCPFEEESWIVTARNRTVAKKFLEGLEFIE